MLKISVQSEDFNVGEEYAALATNASTGAIVFFIGLVRDQNLGEAVSALELEHYPGMTESSLKQIAEQAAKRWPIADASIVHRVGKLTLNEQIVFVGVNAKHRQDAFDAAQFIMDYLKTQAPFWKKEHTAGKAKWLDARESDQQAAKKWQE